MNAAAANSYKRISTVEDQPMTRVLRQREMIENMKHENEVLRLDLTKESRDAKKLASAGAAADIGRYSSKSAAYVLNVLSDL